MTEFLAGLGLFIAALAILAAIADAWDPMGDQRRDSQRRNGR